jgi:hypothetical protein
MCRVREAWGGSEWHLFEVRAQGIRRKQDEVASGPRRAATHPFGQTIRRSHLQMSQKQRREYNKDCKTVAGLEKDMLLTSGAAKSSAVARLKKAWVAFDERWNGCTPTDAQMAAWLQSLHY